MFDTPFNVGDLVMFRKRTQLYECGMAVQEVDFTLFGVRLKVNNQWWVPENFMSHTEWTNLFRKKQ